jgi:hypothetical protein
MKNMKFLVFSFAMAMAAQQELAALQSKAMTKQSSINAFTVNCTEPDCACDSDSDED